MKIVSEYTAEDTSRCQLQVSSHGLQKFINDRYCLSLHWGLNSLYPQGDWLLHHAKIPTEEYKKRVLRFNPCRFNAEEWADLMLESGMKSMMITSKHHDGFCLWDTQLTDFKVTRSPFKRDIISELSKALKERGLGFHFYYSLLDWIHPAYRNDWPAYVAYYQGQLRELLTNYGEIAGVIFDGYWPRQVFDPEEGYFAAGGKWDLAGTYDLIHKLQPNAVITNNTHVAILKGEDYQIWEQDLPGENKTGWNTTEVTDKPKAVWWTLNGSYWFYSPNANQFKKPEEIQQSLMKTNQMGGVFFLNVGPRPYGDIHPEEQLVLREIGRLLKNSKP